MADPEAFLTYAAWESLEFIDPDLYSFDHDMHPVFHVTLGGKLKEQTVMKEEENSAPTVLYVSETPSSSNRVFIINVYELTTQPFSNSHISAMLISVAVPWYVRQQLLPRIEQFFLSTAAANTSRMVIPVVIELTIILNTIVDESIFEEMNYAGLHSDADGSISDSDSDDQSNVPKTVPADPSSIKALKMEKIDESISSEEECSICFEEYIVGVEILHMPCSHVFHCECLTKWLEISNFCPLCKYEMPTKDN